MDIGTVSSDDVMTSYKEQLSDAHHQIAVLTAQLMKAARFMAEKEQGPGAQLVQAEAVDPGGLG